MNCLRQSQRLIAKIGVAAVIATGLIAATRASFTVKGVTYRVRVETRMPNMGFGGGNPGGADVVGGGGGGGGGFPGGFGGVGQLVRVELAGERAKVEFQVGNPPGSS